MIIMLTNSNRSNSVNDTVSLSVDNVALGSGSVEQAIQDRHPATVSLIADYPGQSSPNILQDNSGTQISINRRKSHQSMTARGKRNLPSSRDKLNYGLLNARSINNKTENVTEFILEHELDILCITETWLQPEDKFTASNVTPSGYSIVSNPRLIRRGGGVAAIIKSDLSCKRLTNICFSTFEALLVKISSSSKSFAIGTIYRSPGHPNNFLVEFGEFLSTLIAKYDDFLLGGDFNIHMDNATDESMKKMTSLLHNFGLKQHVNVPTHSGGHILDLVITKNNTQLVQSVAVKEGISDHSSILVSIGFAIEKKKLVKQTFHQFKKLDLAKFQDDICNSELFDNSVADAEILATQYDSVVSDLVSIHAPLTTRTVVPRPPAPWYTSEIAFARKERRRLERRWRHTKLTVDREIFVAQKLVVNNMLHKAKADYYVNLVKSKSDNPKQLWTTIDSLSGNTKSKVLPDHDDLSSLANCFNMYFTDKVTQIREKIHASDRPGTVDDVDSAIPVSATAQMSVFQEIREEDIKHLIRCSPSKSCSLDPIPTYLLHSCEAIVPPIAKMINASLKTGVVPKSFKHALVTPLIKNSKLDPNAMSSYRPISNLKFVSKVLERCVAKQLNSYLSSGGHHETYQSAYRPHHSTETALLHIQNDILTSIDNKEVTLLVLLDLSAAFDTVDHTILLTRLKNIGIIGLAHDWFNSYLTGHTQAVCLNGVSSDSANLTCGVPQGSVLGPILFNIYTQPLGEIARKHGLKYHFYADDTQLYTSFSVKDSNSSIISLSVCIAEIKAWMQSNLLMLNDSKTEVVLIGTKQQLSKFSHLDISVGNASINPCAKVRNLGVIFDSNMTMEAHVNNICKTSYFYIRLLGKLRKFLDKETGAMITHAFVTSRLDYCNSLLYGISSSLSTKLQHVLNTAARIVTRTRIGNHITPVLKTLHWLPVVQRCAFKMALLTFKVIHGLAPSYLCELIRYNSSSRDLRSISDVLLEVPKFKSCLGSCAFVFSAPKL